MYERSGRIVLPPVASLSVSRTCFRSDDAFYTDASCKVALMSSFFGVRVIKDQKEVEKNILFFQSLNSADGRSTKPLTSRSFLWLCAPAISHDDTPEAPASGVFFFWASFP